MTIRKIFATNSLPTLEVDLTIKKGTVTASVPIGTSTSKHEANYLPVDEAIRKFAMVRRHFSMKSFDNPGDVDGTLRAIDDSPNFRDMGGNLSLAISAACLKAFAMEAGIEPFEYIYGYTKDKMKNKEMEMPVPLSNVIGGWHGQSDIQEFMLFPVHQKSFAQSASVLSEAYRDLKDELKKEDTSFAYGKNLESAWVTSLNHETILRILKGIANDRMLKIGLDVAASNLWNGERYVYKRDKLIRTEQIDFMADLAHRFPILFIEDPFDEDDFISHATLTHRLSGRNVMVCGDDLYSTNLYRLQKGIEYKSTNTALVKPNQIGTITDTIRYVVEAKRHNMKTVVSHRSGETDDTLMCHLATGMCCDYIKLGISGERTTKINEMIRIEEKLRLL